MTAASTQSQLPKEVFQNVMKDAFYCSIDNEVRKVGTQFEIDGNAMLSLLTAYDGALHVFPHDSARRRILLCGQHIRIAQHTIAKNVNDCLRRKCHGPYQAT